MAKLAWLACLLYPAVASDNVDVPQRAMGNTSHLRGQSKEAPEAPKADTHPDETTGFDEVGPFSEVPTPHQEENPLPVKPNWDNESGLHATTFSTWGRSFCESHHVGTFCDQTTQVRCCRNFWGYVKCGSTLHSSRCGYHGGGGYGGGGYGGVGGWRIHPGWHESSFCQVRHVGYFCFSHRKTHCCNDYGHFVDCTTRSATSIRC